MHAWRVWSSRSWLHARAGADRVLNSYPACVLVVRPERGVSVLHDRLPFLLAGTARSAAHGGALFCQGACAVLRRLKRPGTATHCTAFNFTACVWHSLCLVNGSLSLCAKRRPVRILCAHSSVNVEVCGFCRKRARQMLAACARPCCTVARCRRCFWAGRRQRCAASGCA